MKTGKLNKPWSSQGEWTTEPDWAVFNGHGFECAMKRNGIGGWCGYVLLPDWHPLHGQDLVAGEPVWLNVHGGVTYHGTMHWHPEMELEPAHVVGFDCAHHGDQTPGEVDAGLLYGEYCNFDYVVSETTNLADQIGRYEPMQQLSQMVSGSKKVK